MIGHGFWGGPGWALLGFLVMVGLGVLVFMLIVGLVRGGGARRGGEPPSVRVLEERYARGEIDRDEFLERRSFLLGEAPPNKPLPPPDES
jgi:putative membrane protein